MLLEHGLVFLDEDDSRSGLEYDLVYDFWNAFNVGSFRSISTYNDDSGFTLAVL